ncbi:sigma 54-interacting transcriptional regulator [Enterococcus camelliae]|uniref:Sigma 54-interacting transcriptional regulator n=1 Tax=Enterococcus camelliae TaxID=453959 RepID=A0ABW5TEW8_9ENTE
MQRIQSSGPEQIHTQNTVSKWMTQEPITIHPNQTIDEAIALFSYHNFYGIPVISENHFLEGMLTKTTIMNALFENKPTKDAVSTIMETTFDAVFPMDPLEKALSMHEGCLPVINDYQQLVGIVTRTDILKARAVQIDTAKHSLTTMSVLQQILDNSYEGIVVVDTRGIITEINDAYCKLLGKKKEFVLQKPVQEVIENTRLHIICQNGEEERNQIQIINGQSLIVHRYPLYENHLLVGATGVLIYRNIDEMYAVTNRLTEEFHDPKTGASSRTSYYLDKIIGHSSISNQLKKRISKIAPLPSNVLITGESGTGKELCAQTIHQLSPAAAGNFVAINCSAIPESLLESELFGYVSGAFTGALKTGKKGKFEQAENGTIFLDEIGDMPLAMQAKLLRVLQEKTIEPVGADYSKKINVRVIAATNQNLREQITRKKFREDLFYRLNVLPIELPSLRENPEDLPILLDHFLTEAARYLHKKVPILDEDARKCLYHYNYPGNIRELANLCESLVGLCENNQVTFTDLPTTIRETWQTYTKHSDSPITNSKNEAEKKLIRQTLAEVNGNKTNCAKKLGISRASLYNKMKRHNLL